MPLLPELERLAALHDAGSLTDEEFAVAKAALLRAADIALPAGEPVPVAAVAPASGSTAASPPVQAAAVVDADVDADDVAALRARLAVLEREAAVQRADREWEVEREAYLIEERAEGLSEPVRVAPTKEGVTMNIVALVFGGVLVFLFLQFFGPGQAGNSGWGGAPDPFDWWLLNGVRVLVVFVVVGGIPTYVRRYRQAEAYEAAKSDYEHRRAELLAGRRDPKA